ncbi:C-X-C motif chemokine 10-like [Hyla sarda]|uniref:C-X-C motif chemokine 10-like n=1 Tax=Hyla sarda TaxID=327740 RepID=UPI0024C2EC22|nr:C-X-C motif chemokine 10-like [Hyla sarda]
MDHKSIVIMCAVLLSATLIEGYAVPRGNRCLCKRNSNKLNVMAMEKLEIHPRSSTCEKIEYIATLKNDSVPKCVSPDLLALKVLLSGKNRHLNHIKVIRHQ